MSNKLKTILVVEDDDAILEVISLILAENGFNVITDSTGDSIMGNDLEAHPDLALIDLVLPRHKGGDLISYIKSHESLKMVPCILMSAYGESKVAAIAKEVQADDYLLKPFEVNMLVGKIQKFME